MSNLTHKKCIIVCEMAAILSRPQYVLKNVSDA